MINILKTNNQLLLEYQPDRFNDVTWLDEKLNQDESVTLRRTFTFTHADLIPTATTQADESPVRVFVLGVAEGDYYKVSQDILGIKNDLLLHTGLTLKSNTFVANRDISVFRKIDELIEEPIVIGGDNENAIPQDDFEQLLQTFPTTTELTHYARSRIARVLKDYFDTLTDAETQLKKHLERKPALSDTALRTSFIADVEQQKFKYILAELKDMLKEPDSYQEKDWQKKILGLLLFIFPKYIAVLENVHIKDFYSKANVTNRYIDLMLVDADGNIDIIEVKKPFPNALLSRHQYRGNHTPRTELAGSIMQAEKYLFHLSKWGHTGEQEIYNQRKNELPQQIKLKITNPKALILLGRDNDFTNEQRFDFEIIRRKYANMMDIMTYDDLIRRLENIIEMMSRHLPIQAVPGGSEIP